MSIAQFVENSQQAGSLDDLRALLVDETRAHGFDYTVYCQVSRYQASGDPASLVPVSTLPEVWVAHYLRNGYSDIDPVIHRARHTARPFLWRDVWDAGLLRKQKDLREESSMVGLRSGVTVPLFGPGGQAALLSVSGADAEAERPDVARAIGAIGMQFQLVYQDLAQEEPDDAVPAFVPLTPREREVLLWAARGKSNWDISQILNVSESAVNFHITNAMRKLEASSRVLAVLKAIRHGLIIP
ncbi:regulatory protein, LuxR [Caenispirillum salinarum AK4]|uniref:Regulatory protein, LuxR n=1 Tax=Caenispirillum salinarum AK4 TaxID=1238182 RepID=K9H543_9PROT|nr:LuxR family transcriptional regulator [Caenispirillum salinarum]EKV32657.1 regulatory protein, LuxR [Caenispirillum salinarum AK4]